MVHEQPPSAQQLPYTTMQLAGHATGVTVEALTGRSPWMLGIVLLNVIGIASAVYFLNLLIKGQQTHLNALLNVQQQQMQLVIRTHDREFDALMKMLAENKPVPPPVLEEGIPLPLPRP